MAFWVRIGGPNKLERVSRQCWRLYSIACRTRAWIGHADESCMLGPKELMCSGPAIYRNPNLQFIPVRSFAAPKSSKKAQEKEVVVTRTNEEITAEYVRLVTDEGHGIVTKREALHRARELDLDLVEVSREADPPVCKIMDFYKEKFRKGLKDKELAKTKADTTVRKGDYKEVHFTGKIEKKDLEMKAETVKRLMERGYRVKVVAEAGKKSDSCDAEKEDLGVVLSRLYKLIEDVSAIESPPRVEKRTAYLIVRHPKFGTKKNPAKKNNKIDQTTSSDANVNSVTPPVSSPTFVQATEVSETVDTGLRAEKNLLSGTQVPHTPLSRESPRNPTSLSPQSPYISRVPAASGVISRERNPILKDYSDVASKSDQRAGSIPTGSIPIKSEPPTELSNRYKKSVPNGSLNGGRSPSQPSFVKIRNEGMLNPRQRNTFPGTPDSRGRAPLRPPPDKSQQSANLDRKSRSPLPQGPNRSPSFGIFGTPKSGGPNPADLNRD